DLVSRARALGPFPGCDRSEHLGARPAFCVDRPIAAKAVEPLAVVVCSEEERDELARLELTTQVVELRGELDDRAAGDVRRLVGGLQEDQRASEPIGRMAAKRRVAGVLESAAKGLGRVGE